MRSKGRARKYSVGDKVTYNKQKYSITNIMQFRDPEGTLTDCYFLSSLDGKTIPQYAAVNAALLSLDYTHEETEELLRRAQETYGNQNQVIVTAEECTELAQICLKYARYTSPEEFNEVFRDKLISEIVDVLICIRHLRGIFKVTPEEEKVETNRKLRRLESWLNKSSDFNHTTKERDIPND